MAFYCVDFFSGREKSINMCVCQVSGSRVYEIESIKINKRIIRCSVIFDKADGFENLIELSKTRVGKIGFQF